MAPNSTTWTDTLEKQFLLDIIDRTETKVSSAILDDLANKYGKPHTRGSLSKKLGRMKKAIAEENMKVEDSGDAKTGDKRKTSEDEDEDEDANGTPAKKLKASKARKSTKVKAELSD